MPDVAEFVLNRLAERGVDRVFGYPGDRINAFPGAHEKVDAPQFIQARHEEIAAFMACAHAKFTGKIGACMATSGPGAVHLANGLYDAKDVGPTWDRAFAADKPVLLAEAKEHLPGAGR